MKSLKWIAWGMLLLSMALCAKAQTNSARAGRFVRGTGSDPEQQSFVIALDFQKGVPLNDVGEELYGVSFDPWYHFDATDLFSTNSITGRIPFSNPIVSFGSRLGGSTLYTDRQYRFGAYGGYNGYGTNYEQLRIYVHDKNNDFEPVGAISLVFPTRNQTNAWNQFASNNFTVTASGYGLRTTATIARNWRWGVSYQDSYLLTHEAEAEATNYLFIVSCIGFFDVGDNFYPMVMWEDGSPDWGDLYSLEFEERPRSLAAFLDQPHFAGEPLPFQYLGKTPQELTNLVASITNEVWLTNGNYTLIDGSPELRRHPILDNFVSQMRNDPIALARYVFNEIELSDGMALPGGGLNTFPAINCGGVSRGALPAAPGRLRGRVRIPDKRESENAGFPDEPAFADAGSWGYLLEQ